MVESDRQESKVNQWFSSAGGGGRTEYIFIMIFSSSIDVSLMEEGGSKIDQQICTTQGV